jgi:hypothetical protein
MDNSYWIPVTWRQNPHNYRVTKDRFWEGCYGNLPVKALCVTSKRWRQRNRRASSFYCYGCVLLFYMLSVYLHTLQQFTILILQTAALLAWESVFTDVSRREFLEVGLHVLVCCTNQMHKVTYKRILNTLLHVSVNIYHPQAVHCVEIKID